MYNLKKLRLHIGYYRLDRRFLKVDLPKLTEGEKRLLKETWPCLSILPCDYICYKRAIRIINTFLNTEFLGGKYQSRIEEMEKIK